MNGIQKFSIGKVVLLFLFVLRFACSSLFIHTHVIEGVVHVHSHPFSSGAESDDNHSEGELLFLDNVFQTVCTNDITLKFDTEAILLASEENYINNSCPKASSGSDPSPSLRAPPANI